MSTNLQIDRLVRPFRSAASCLAIASTIQRRLLFSFLIAVVVVLVGNPLHQGSTPPQALSADGGNVGESDPEPAGSGDVPPPPPAGDTPPPPPSGNVPPSPTPFVQIEHLTAANVYGDMWIVEGLVSGNVPVQGLTVTLGGLANGRTTPVTSDDTFLIIMSIPPSVSGDISAVVQGPDGVDSPMVIIPIMAGIAIGGA